jgi:hypothetical protein
MPRSQLHTDRGVECDGHGCGLRIPGHGEYDTGAERQQNGLGADTGGGSESVQDLLIRGYTMHVVSLGSGGLRR